MVTITPERAGDRQRGAGRAHQRFRPAESPGCRGKTWRLFRQTGPAGPSRVEVRWSGAVTRKPTTLVVRHEAMLPLIIAEATWPGWRMTTGAAPDARTACWTWRPAGSRAATPG